MTTAPVGHPYIWWHAFLHAHPDDRLRLRADYNWQFHLETWVVVDHNRRF
ncbi:MAG: hypothetical protein JXB38_06105 [Anaerolineales bacterium]|nr:hypothetical protein [Anaerolineales bacterium]